MNNYKIKVNSKVESKEAQDLFFELGFTWGGNSKDIFDFDTPEYIVNWSNNHITVGDNLDENRKEITLAELRDMVVLKRNDINDATHESSIYKYFKACDGWYYFDLGCTDKWQKSVGAKPEYYEKLKPIEKTMKKEYLIPSRNYEYILIGVRESLELHAKGWIEIPGGADVLADLANDLVFYKSGNPFQWWNAEKKEWLNCADIVNIDVFKNILWQRPTQPEELPFIDDEPQSLNNQYAEIEQVRQDVVNHPNHYTQGKVECIDALEAATVGKAGIEAVCVANVIKYLWRYEEKNGKEDIKKAQWYLNKLLDSID